MNYYHDLVTQKSWLELTQLVKQVPFILIGGWAVYLYAKTLKSKDIDIIVTFDTLSTFKKLYDMQKNDRLRKYEAVRGEVQIDIYLPHFSALGIPVEELIDKTRVVEGFSVVDPNYLFALKLFTLKERGRAPKGRKDFLDLISLIISQSINLKVATKSIQQYHIDDSKNVFAVFLQEHTQIPELNLSTHQYAKLKKETAELLHLSV